MICWLVKYSQPLIDFTVRRRKKAISNIQWPQKKQTTIKEVITDNGINLSFLINLTYKFNLFQSY